MCALPARKSSLKKAAAVFRLPLGKEIIGAPDWDRTSDLQLRKLTLFQLSYGYRAKRAQEYPKKRRLAKKPAPAARIFRLPPPCFFLTHAKISDWKGKAD